jgi:hypothetical protein
MVKAENSPAIGPTLTLFSFLFMYHCNIKKHPQQAGGHRFIIFSLVRNKQKQFNHHNQPKGK